MKNLMSNLVGTSFIVIILLLLYFTTSFYKREANVYKNIAASLEDTLRVRKDKDSTSYARISVLETNKVKDFLKIQTKDKEIIELQKIIKKYEKEIKNKGSITNVETESSYNKETKIQVDTVCGKCAFDYSDSTDWINTHISFKPTISDINTSNLNISYKIKNRYSVIIGEEKQGLFKKSKPFVEVMNENPYTEVKSLRTYQVSKPREKKIGVGPNISIGGNNQGFSWFIGIGAQYNIIKF